MNILLVTPSFLNYESNASGMPMAVYRIAKGLQLLGHNPMIVAGGIINRHESYDGIPLWRVRTRRTSVCNSRIVDMIVECFYGNYLLQKKVTEICQLHKIHIIQYSGNNGTGMFHFNRHIPAVMRVSSYFGTLYRDYVLYSKAEVRCHSFFERLAMKRMNGIYCPSQILAQDLETMLGKKIRVLETPFWIDCKEDYRKYDKCLKGKRYFLFFGRIEPDKGVLLIAENINGILSKYRDCYFVFIGNDSKVKGVSTVKAIKQKVDNQFSGRVIFMNSEPHEVLYPIIRNSEMVLLPSYSENLSNACIESMALGKIVIGTEEESFGQLIENGKDGYLISRGNSRQLHESICKVMEMSSGQKAEMEQNAKKRVAHLRPEESIKALVNYYEEMIGRGEQ